MSEKILLNGQEGDLFADQEAIQKMMEILSAPQLSGCRDLAQDIGTFLGDHFLLSTYPTIAGATIVVYNGCHYPEHIHIRLGTKPRRVAESLVHELLHAELLRLVLP